MGPAPGSATNARIRWASGALPLAETPHKIVINMIIIMICLIIIISSSSNIISSMFIIIIQFVIIIITIFRWPDQQESSHIQGKLHTPNPPTNIAPC